MTKLPPGMDNESTQMLSMVNQIMNAPPMLDVGQQDPYGLVIASLVAAVEAILKNKMLR